MAPAATKEDIIRLERKLDALMSLIAQPTEQKQTYDHDEEIRMVLDQGLDPLEYLRSKLARDTTTTRKTNGGKHARDKKGR